MTEPFISEPYWHLSKYRLLEWTIEPVENRIASIHKHKPADERVLWLKLLRPVRGKLPMAVVEAWRARDEARRAHDEAWRALNEAWITWDEVERIWDEAWIAYEEAWRAYEDARCAHEEAERAHEEAECAEDETRRAHEEVKHAYSHEINALHAAECEPDCPWDGETIFPEVSR